MGYQKNHFVVYKYGMSFEKELVQDQLNEIETLFDEITGMRMDDDVVVYIGAITKELLVYKNIVNYNNIRIDMT